MPKPFEHNGQRYEWSYERNDYLPVGDTGPLQAIHAGVYEGLAGFGANVAELLGNKEEADAVRQEMAARTQAAGGLTSQTGPATGGQIAGGAFPYAGGMMPGLGTAATMGIEAGLGFIGSQGDATQRATNALIAAGVAGTPAGAARLMRGMGSGVRAARVGGVAGAVFQQARRAGQSLGETLESYRINVGAGSAGAARAPDRGLGANRLFPDERQAIMGEATPAIDAMLDAPGGEVTGGMQRAIARDAASETGQIARANMEGNFTRWLGEQLGVAGGRFDKTAISDAAYDVVGPRIGQIEELAQIGKLSDDVVDYAGKLAAAGDNQPLLNRVANELANVSDATSMQQARNVLTDAISTADDRGLNDVRKALLNIEERFHDDVLKKLPDELKKEYSEEKMKYAILMRLLDSETILTGGNKFNVKSFVNRMSAEYKPFRTGQDMSDIGRAVRTMQDIQQTFTTGSNTFEKLMPWIVGGSALGGAGSLLD